MSLHDEYARLCSTPSDIYLHLPRLYGLVLETQAQHVIELGTRTGVSTVAFLAALETTGGHLTSVDLDPKPPIGDHEQWRFIQGDDTDPLVFAALDPAGIVFIDTSHAFHHTMEELVVYAPRVSSGGFIVLHDTEVERPDGTNETNFADLAECGVHFSPQTLSPADQKLILGSVIHQKFKKAEAALR